MPQSSTEPVSPLADTDSAGAAAAASDKSVLVLGTTEDAAHVEAIAAALSHHGLTATAYSGTMAGAAAAAEAARCVVVVWTQLTLSGHGSVVRDLAEYARERHALVSVLIDPVVPTVTMGEQPALDLTQWNRQPGDGWLRDVVAAVRARLKGQPLPVARVPLWRERRTRFVRSVIALVVFVLVSFALDLFHLQRKVCYLPINQPELADACGALGLGELPTKEERLAWYAKEPGSCEDLRKHLERFPNGAYKHRAADWLAQPRKERTAEFAISTDEVPGYVNPPDQGVGDESQAQRYAVARAEADSEEFLCHSMDQERVLQDVKVVVGKYECRQREKGGYACGLEFTAQCKVKTRVFRDRCGG